jgi:hypothetical protein
VGLAAIVAVEATCIAKNTFQLDHQASMKYAVTESDERQAFYLKAPLDDAMDDFTGLDHLDAIIRTESMFLHLAFYSYALTNMALSDERYRDFAKEYIEKAIQKSMRPRILTDFSVYFGNPLEKKNHDNVLYRGHLNLMMGAFTLISGDHKYKEMQQAMTEALSRDFLASPSHHLQSYAGKIWPADNVVGLASIALYDYLYGENHRHVIDQWKQWTLKNLDENGLPYSRISYRTQTPDAAARGCAIAFSIPFISMFDQEFAGELYDKFRHAFFKEILGIPFARESLQEHFPSDADSGPIIFGIGTTASAFSIGAAKITGDYETFTRLSTIAEVVTLPYETLYGKGYLANVSLGEAVLLYGRTLRPWF